MTDAQTITRFLRTFTRDQDPELFLVLASRNAHTTERVYRRFLVSNLQEAIEWAILQDEANFDVFYKTALLKPDSIRMIKENFQDEVVWLWADLDEMRPETLPAVPTFLIESSPGRYQALWRLNAPTDKYLAERYCRALSVFGDASGWDIGQELRIPGTRNFKYAEAPTVAVVGFSGESIVDVQMLDQLGIVPVDTFSGDLESGPDGLPEPWDGITPPYAIEEMATPRKRSLALWSSLNRLKDEGWTANDAFQMMWWSPQNKYRLDGRSPRDLWRDVAKCWAQMKEHEADLEISIPQKQPTRDLGEIHTIGWWPHLCQLAIETFRGPTLFNDETIALMFLSGFSASFPQITIQGGNLGLWTMLLARQASGKSTLIQNISEMVHSISPALNIVTSGSPEGIMEKVAEGPSLLAYEEYSEQLKQMARKDGYAQTNKEVYSRMFDGASLGHATRRSAIQAEKTFAVMMASTNVDTWRQYGDPEDMANGYLSRFIVIADNLERRSINRSALSGDLERLRIATHERVSLANGTSKVELSHIGASHTEDLVRVHQLVPGIDTSAGDLIMLEYQAELEALWQPEGDLDELERGAAYDVPPGRTLTKARKLAALLELCEMHPQVYGEVMFVRDRNTKLAVELANRSMIWAQRSIDWLSESTEKKYVDRIIARLEKEYPEWVRPWDVAVNIRGLRAEEVKRLLKTLQDSGMVEMKRVSRENGQTSELWRVSK